MPSPPAFAKAAGPRKPQGCTCFRLRKLTRRVTQHFDGYLARIGLRVTQYSLLAMLLDDEPVALSQLADRMAMDRTTLTRNLRPLQAAGWLELVVGRDARRRMVVITLAGHAVMLQAKPLWRTAQEALNDELGWERVAELHELLDVSIGLVRPAGQPA